MATEDLRVVQEYGSEYAGELVGWLDIQRRDYKDDADLVLAGIAYARVGKDGARYTVYEHEPGKFSYTANSISGFEKTVQLNISATDAPGEFVRATPGQTPRWDRKHLGFGSYPHCHFADRLDYGRPEDQNGTWIMGAGNILDGLKQQLSTARTEFLYPIAYYTLAAMADAEDQLVDPMMSHITGIEVKLAEYRLKQLLELRSLDEAMDHQIDEAPTSKLPEVVNDFVASRRMIAAVERELLELEETSALRGRLMLPVGEGSGVRTWPFMDASEGNEQVAFGQERQALERGEGGSVAYQLRREVTELTVRIDNAGLIYSLLFSLATKERAAALIGQ